MIPNDCVIVKPKEGVSPFTHLTWNSNGCPKTIPLDIYKLNEYRLDLVKDPHNILPLSAPIPEEILKPEEKPSEPEIDLEKEVKDVVNEALDLVKKVKKVGKGKNKKR